MHKTKTLKTEVAKYNSAIQPYDWSHSFSRKTSTESKQLETYEVYFGFQRNDGSENETKAAFRQNYVSSLACVTEFNTTVSAAAASLHHAFIELEIITPMTSPSSSE